MNFVVSFFRSSVTCCDPNTIETPFPSRYLFNFLFWIKKIKSPDTKSGDMHFNKKIWKPDKKIWDFLEGFLFLSFLFLFYDILQFYLEHWTLHIVHCISNILLLFSATELREGTWIMSGNSVLKDGRSINENYGTDLDKLEEGDRVGVLRTG